MDELRKQNKTWNLNEIRNAKNKAAENALHEIKFRALSDELFKYLDQYYDNDWSDFGAFSSYYASVRKENTNKKRTWWRNNIKNLLSSNFGLQLNLKLVQGQQRPEKITRELEIKFKSFMNKKIPHDKKEKIPANARNPKMEPIGTFLAGLELFNKTPPIDDKQLVKNAIDRIKKWYNYCLSNEIIDNENAASYLNWWTIVDPKEYKNAYEKFFVNQWNEDTLSCFANDYCKEKVYSIN